MNVLKIAQAAAKLLKLSHGRMEYIRLLKLLYLADRWSLRHAGFAISGDWYVAMAHGPVPSAVYDLVKGSHWGSETWDKFIQTEGRDIVLVGDPGNGLLSRHDVEVLQTISDRFAALGTWHLIRLMHRKCPEWKLPKGQKSAEIPLDEILRAVGMEANISAIENDLHALEVADRAAQRLRTKTA